jgi:uncharacterized protein
MNTKYYSLITGASEGLGKALAIECAARNQNLVLVALPGSGLHHLKLFLEKNFAVDVVILEKDLIKSESCAEIFHQTAIMGLKINTLINNAGMGNSAYFRETSPAMLENLLDLNIKSVTLLTHYFIEQLDKNTASYILNISSLCNYFYLPEKQVYGGTKSFIYYFSRALRRELKQDNISVSVLCPGGVNNNLHATLAHRKLNWFLRISIMNPEELAPIAIRGLLKGKKVIIPGKINRLFVFLDPLVPAFIKDHFAIKNLKNGKAVHKWSSHLLQKTSTEKTLHQAI